jgi:phosphoesterase RecJ-like protein
VTPISEATWAGAVDAIRGNLAPGSRVLLACHVNPDGDALGSMLGFAQGLLQLGVTELQCSFPRALERAGSAEHAGDAFAGTRGDGL